MKSLAGVGDTHGYKEYWTGEYMFAQLGYIMPGSGGYLDTEITGTT